MSCGVPILGWRTSQIKAAQHGNHNVGDLTARGSAGHRHRGTASAPAPAERSAPTRGEWDGTGRNRRLGTYTGRYDEVRALRHTLVLLNLDTPLPQDVVIGSISELVRHTRQSAADTDTGYQRVYWAGWVRGHQVVHGERLRSFGHRHPRPEGVWAITERLTAGIVVKEPVALEAWLSMVQRRERLDLVAVLAAEDGLLGLAPDWARRYCRRWVWVRG